MVKIAREVHEEIFNRTKRVRDLYEKKQKEQKGISAIRKGKPRARTVQNTPKGINAIRICKPKGARAVQKEELKRIRELRETKS